MNLNLLHTFQVLAETLNFTEAARRLHTVQPAISRQIKGLEESLGYELFDRSRKKVALTPEGMQLLEKITRPLSELDVAIRPHVSKSEPEGDLFVGSTPEAGAKFLWPELLWLQSRFPKVKVHLTLAPSRDVVSMLQSGQLQFGLVSSAPKAKMFEVSAPIRDASVLIQFKKTRHKNWQQRDTFDFVTYRDQDPFTTQFLRTHMPSRIRGQIRERAIVNSHIAMIDAVIANDWLAVLPRSSAVAFAKAGEIDIVIEDKRRASLYLICMNRFLTQAQNQIVWKEMNGRLGRFTSKRES